MIYNLYYTEFEFIPSMEFVVLLSVFAITLTQVIARPADMEDDSKTKNSKEEYNLELFKFMLPTLLRHDMQISIKGVLDLSAENFTFVLPIEGKEENTHCTLNFNYKNKTLHVSPAAGEDQKEKQYEISYEDVERPDFVLSLCARENDNKERTLEMALNALEYGDSTIMACKMNSFEDFGHIQFKGVKNINSILFNF